MSNDAGKKNSIWEKLFAQRKSSIALYSMSTSLSMLVKEKLAYANGLAIKGDKLYISTTQRKDLLEMQIAINGSLSLSRRFKGQKGMDNLTIAGDYLLFPTHPRFMKFIAHMRNASKLSPADVYAYNLKDGSFVRIFSDTGERISAPATALYYRENLYIGQVFNNHLLKVRITLE